MTTGHSGIHDCGGAGEGLVLTVGVEVENEPHLGQRDRVGRRAADAPVSVDSDRRLVGGLLHLIERYADYGRPAVAEP